MEYTLIEHNAPLTMVKIEEHLQGQRTSYTILEIDNSFLSNYTGAVETLNYLVSRNRVIVVTENMNDSLRKLLIHCGIAHCFTSTEARLLQEHFDSLSSSSGGINRGKILVLDDLPQYKSILKAVTESLEYSCDFTNNVDELFKLVGMNKYQLILMNIGTKKVDMNRIIRKSYTNHAIKRVPIIAYKNMDHGIFVHEFLNGLKKLTKIILSPEELFCAIFELLYKKRIMTCISSMNEAVSFENYSNYPEESIAKIYYEIHGELCSQENICTDEHIRALRKNIDEMQNIVIRSESIRWLKKCSNKRKSLCGDFCQS